MSWSNIHVDDYGYPAWLTVQQDGAAVDISSYTTRQYRLRAPSGAVKTVTATFLADGTNGALAYTMADTVIDEVGTWQVEVYLTKTGAELTSKPHDFQVLPRLGT